MDFHRKSHNSVGCFTKNIDHFPDMTILFHILYKYEDSGSEFDSFHSFYLWNILFTL